MAVVHISIKFRADIFMSWGVIDIFPKLHMAAAAIFDFLRNHRSTHEGIVMVRTACIKFVMIS